MSDKGKRIKKIPAGDTHERNVCADCDHVEYNNPTIVNIVVATYKNEILFCKRAIEPRIGCWTLPGGYMESGETPQQGAAREALEEAGVKVKIGPLLAMYQPPSKNKVIMIFHGELPSREADPGTESQEVEFFKWEDIPWKELAFPYIKDALDVYQKTKGKTNFQPEMIESKFYFDPKQPLPKCDKPKPPQP